MFTIKPHIAQRFATWGHIWEYANDAGFQQTRALAAAASGGLFGVGAGKGWLQSIFAADTDMVFAVVSEELGLIVALCAILAIIVLAAFTVKNASQGRSSFYVIAACAAVSMLMVQMGLNVFGSLDILPFTGAPSPLFQRAAPAYFMLGAACLYKSFGYAPERQLQRQAAFEAERI
jgi:cell division protein FtsW (lipid II flippase)